MTRIRSLFIFASLAVAAPLGCGDDEELDLSGVGGAGGSVTGGGGGTGASGGSDSGTGASGGSSGSGAGGGGTGGDGGAAGGSAGADAGGCPVQGTTYQFNWCPTLMSQGAAVGNSASIIPGYFGAIHADCRVSKLVDQHPDLASFGNDLASFTLQLWGCQGDGVQDFGLVHTGDPDAGTFPVLTAADTALLIKLYVARTKLVLGLGPSLENLLTDTLNCLAEGLITNPSTTDYTFSVCPPDAGVDGSDDAGDDATDADDDGGTD